VFRLQGRQSLSREAIYLIIDLLVVYIAQENQIPILVALLDG
jgi:hypothetical protein